MSLGSYAPKAEEIFSAPVREPDGFGDAVSHILRLTTRCLKFPLAAIVFDDGTQRHLAAQYGMSEGEAEAIFEAFWPLFREQQRCLVIHDTFEEPRLETEAPRVGGKPIRFAATISKAIGAGEFCGSVWVFGFDPVEELCAEEREDLRAFSALIQDELDMRRAYRELEKAGRDLSAMLQVLPDVLVVADRERQIRTVNRGFKEQFGYEKDEALGRTTEFLYADRQVYCQMAEHYNPEAENPEAPYVVEYRRKDGTTFLGRTVAVHVRDAEGRTVGYLGIIEDVTESTRLAEEREAALEQLRHSEELLAETSRLASIGGGEFDLRTNELRWSDELYRLHDLPIGAPLTVEKTLEPFDDRDRERFEEASKGVLSQGESFTLEMPMTTAAGRRRWVRVKGFPVVEDGQIVGMRGYHQDITEEKQAELAKREFISVVSHELRTPLTSIQGALSLVVHGVMGKLPEEAEELLRVAHKNGERLASLLNDILDIEKIESGKITIDLQPLDVAEAIDEVIEANQRYAAEFDVALQAFHNPEPLCMHVDGAKLHQVLTNLISNAIKYSPAGGVVAIKAGLVDEQTVRISVKDRGPGIPRSFHDQLFEKFTRADTSDTRRLPGTGLGLSIARSLTEEMKGRIDFETDEGKGTTMFVEFPRCAPPRDRER